MTKSLQYFVPLVAVSLLLAFFFLSMGQAEYASANAANATNIGTATSSAAVAVTSSQRILATTTNARGNGTSYTRVFASICNPSSTVVYLNLDGDKAASLSSFTVAIAAAAGYDACYEITDRNAYQGSITASSTNQTAVTVYAKDYVQ